MKTCLTLSILSLAIASSLSAQAPAMIRRGNVLSWSASSNNKGTLRIVAVEGQYFEAEQTNENNRAAGVIKLYGAIVDNGHRVVLINSGQWKEVWDGQVLPNEISGRLSAGAGSFTFRISGAAASAPPPPPPPPPIASTGPFTMGRTFRWTTDAVGGQNGTLYVASTRGGTFFLEQKNEKNRAAGTIQLEGELKDGKVYIYNKKYHETWVGILSGGAVSGKIDNRFNFRIFE
jgi:hypothetical protein